MKLALVTNYPPDRRTLSEYGYYLAHGLRESRHGEEVTILAGRYPIQSGDGELRIWSYGSPYIPLQIMGALKTQRVDGVLFSTNFTTWGGNLANFMGLMTPMFVARRLGIKVLTLLHYLPQTIDAKRTGYRLTPFHQVAIELVCRALARSDVVCFTLQKDVDYFAAHYKPRRVVLVPLGIMGKPSWQPFSSGSNCVLTFGKWGGSKNPEAVIRCFLEKVIEGQLIVAGGSSPTRSGFLEELRKKYSSTNVTFTGYVPESEVPNLFHSAHLVVLPYEENPGVSAVLLQTCQYGRVPLIRRLPVFEQMVRELGLTAFFYDTEDDLRRVLKAFFQDKVLLVEGGRRNMEAVKGLTMDHIGQIYWRLLEN